MRTSGKAFGALPTAGLRVTIASLFLLPLLAARGQLPALRQHWKLSFTVGVLNSAIPFACLSWALLSISTGLSALINATVPLFGAAIAWWWLGDKLQGSRVLGLVIGFAGVALLALFRDTGAGHAEGASGWLAILACLTACFFYGLSASFTRALFYPVCPLWCSRPAASWAHRWHCCHSPGGRGLQRQRLRRPGAQSSRSAWSAPVWPM